MLGWLSCLAAGVVGAYEIAAVEVTHPHPSLERVKYEVSAGESPLDTFSIIHVTRRGSPPGHPVVLLSPYALPGEFYEVSETGSYARSAAGDLARRGYDLWLVDHRQTGLAPGTCESGAVDCSSMASWDFDVLSSDALFALSLVRMHTTEKPVIGGFSAGANAAIATVNRAPDAFSGLFAYEGTFYTEDAAIRAHNDAVCTSTEAALASGAVYDPSVAVLGMVLRAAAADPSGLFAPPIFPPGTTNQQALLLVYGAPPPPGALAPTADFVRLRADFSTESLVYSDQDRLELLGTLFDNYGSVAAVRDLACGLAGRDTRHYENLGSFGGHVLEYVGGSGFGAAMFDTATLFENARSITVENRPELGEADFYFHTESRSAFVNPLVSWLDRVF